MTDDTGAVDPIAHEAPATSALDPDGSLRDLAGDCVHCGFCLPACPTYQLWGEEMDSPRGRIHLITQVLETGTGTAATAEHLDRCLGCMACVTACPSGVQYNQLIEAARAWAEQGEAPRTGSVGEPAAAPFRARSRRERAVRAAIFATFPYPARLRAALAPLRVAQISGLDKLAARSKLLRRMAPEVAAALAVAPGRSARRRHPSALPARTCSYSFIAEPQPAAFTTTASTPACSNALIVALANALASACRPPCNDSAPQQP